MRYQVFISYSHFASGKLAPALQTGLHRFARPWFKLRALTAFRDQTDLSASPGLWSKIKAALVDSEYLLLLCSPDAAQSKWVKREVEFWLQRRSPDTLLLVQTEGEVVWNETVGDFDWELSDAIPPILKSAFREEPFIPDVRWIRVAEDLSLSNIQFREVIATIASTLHGKPKNELIGIDVREHRRTLRLAWSSVLALTTLFIASLFATYLAVQGQQRAEHQSRVAQVRQLNAQAELVRTRALDLLPISTLLALESIQRIPTSDADQILRANINLLPKKIVSFPVNIAETEQVRFSEDGEIFFMRDIDGKLVLASGRTGAVLGEWESPNYPEVRINRDKTHFAVVGSDAFSPYTDDILYALVRDIGTKQIVARVPHLQGMQAYGFSPSARYLAFSRWKELMIWDVSRNEEAYRLTHESSIESFMFSPSNEFVAVTTADGHTLWNLADGSQKFYKYGGKSLRAAFQSDGRVVAFAVSDEPSIYFYETETGELITNIKLHSVPERLEFSPAGDLLGVKGEDGTVSFWDLTDLSERMRFSLTDEDDQFLGFSETGELFATSGAAATQIWDTNSGREVTRVSEELFRGVRNLAWGKSGNRISVLSGTTVSVLEPDLQPSVYAVSHSGHVQAVSFSPDGKLFASTGLDQSIHVWGVESGKEHALIFVGGHGALYQLAFTPDGQYLIAGTSEGTLIFFNTNFATEILLEGKDGVPLPYLNQDQAEFVIESGGSLMHDLSLSLDGNLAVTNSESGLQIWSVTERRKLTSLVEQGVVYGIAFDPTGRLLATGEGVLETEDKSSNGANQVRVWDWRHGRELMRLPHEHAVYRVAYSADGRTLATASRGIVLVWDAESGELIHELVHERPVNALVFDQTGTRLVTGTGPTVIRAGPHLVTVWDLETGQELNRIDHDMAVFDVALSPDEKHIASASMDRHAYLWLWKPEDVVEQACSRLSRNLSDGEWKRYLGLLPYRETCPGLPIPVD